MGGLANIQRRVYKWSVKCVRQSKWLMSGIVSFALFGWLLASNHCGLATIALASNVQTTHTCCHDDSSTLPIHTSQCCDSLSAPLPSLAFAPDATWHQLYAVPFAALEPVLELAVVSFPQTLGAQAPPGSSYFVSVVLKRSMPSLAPPQVA